MNDKWISEFIELVRYAADCIENAEDQLDLGCMAGSAPGPSEKSQLLLFMAGQLETFLRHQTTTLKIDKDYLIDLISGYVNQIEDVDGDIGVSYVKQTFTALEKLGILSFK